MYSVVFKAFEYIPLIGPTVEYTHIFYPTACKIPGLGLRLYATDYLVKEDGTAVEEYKIDVTSFFQRDLDLLKKKGISLKPTDCRSVQLVSDHGI